MRQDIHVFTFLVSSLGEHDNLVRRISALKKIFGPARITFDKDFVNLSKIQPVTLQRKFGLLLNDLVQTALFHFQGNIVGKLLFRKCAGPLGIEEHVGKIVLDEIH